MKKLHHRLLVAFLIMALGNNIKKKRPFKRYFPGYVKLLCVFIFSMQILFCPTNQKNTKLIFFVTKMKLFGIKLIFFSCIYEPPYMPGSRIFCQTERVCIDFSGLKSCLNSVKYFDLLKVSKNE